MRPARYWRAIAALTGLALAGRIGWAVDRTRSPIVVALVSEESLPGSSPSGGPAAGPVSPVPSAVASPGASNHSDSSTDWQRTQGGAADVSHNPTARLSLGSSNPAITMSPAGEASLAAPTPIPSALDVSTTSTGPELDQLSLAPEIKLAATPERAASLRLTEQARQELAEGAGDGALRDLGRAVSIDPEDPFEYYYLGRVYLVRKNYAQALTFFQRSELGFAGRPAWLGESLTLEGACDEELGRTPDAAKAYQRAVAAAPDNLRARLGYGRLIPNLVPASGLDTSPPVAVEPPGPPPAAAPAPPPAEPPPPGTDSRD